MEIITFRELEDKDQFMLLMDLAFNWPIVPQQLEKIINLDIRLKSSPVGFCAVEDGKLLGFVGVLDIPTRIISGELEMVGGIWCVATNPGAVKKGISKILMDRAHQYFYDKKYKFSFLLTNKTWIAYSMYLKMDYSEVEQVNQYPLVYKVLKRDKGEQKVEGILDSAKVYQIFQESVKDKSGFIIRQIDFLDLFRKRRRFEERKSILEDKGYALVAETSEVVRIGELISLDEQTYQKLLEQIESISGGGVIDPMVTDQKLLEIYRAKGYHTQKESHLVFMVKHLAEVKFQQAYQDKFHIRGQDLF